MQFAKYIVIFGVAAIFACVITSLVTYTNVIRKCDRSGFSADRFLAYCDDLKFGDYEHGAYFYNLEPDAVENAKKADVLFLGNSKTEFAFSGKAVPEFFRERHLRYYMLAFDEGETSRFAEAVIQRYNLHPKFLVINADPFFSNVLGDGSGGDARFFFGHSAPSNHFKYILKKIAEGMSDTLCGEVPSACPNIFYDVYRSRTDGRWDLDHWHADKNIPFVVTPSFNPDTFAQLNVLDGTRQDLGALVRVGKEFLGTVGVPRNCVVLTGIPQPGRDNQGVAEALAKGIGTQLLNISVENMATVDGQHMAEGSADRW